MFLNIMLHVLKLNNQPYLNSEGYVCVEVTTAKVSATIPNIISSLKCIIGNCMSLIHVQHARLLFGGVKYSELS